MHFPTHRGNERCSFLLGESIPNDIIANSTQVNDFSKLHFIQLYGTEELLMLLLLFPCLQTCKFRFEMSFGGFVPFKCMCAYICMFSCFPKGHKHCCRSSYRYRCLHRRFHRNRQDPQPDGINRTREDPAATEAG